MKSFRGEYEIQTETTEIKATSRKLTGNWTFEMSNGLEVYGFPDGTFTPEQIFDDRAWPRDQNGKPTHLKPLLSVDDLQNDMLVVWKGLPHDYCWQRGRVCFDGKGVWINGDGFTSSPRWEEGRGWLTDGSFTWATSSSR